MANFKSEGFFRMAFEDKVLTCRDCGQEFVFTAGEQEFYAEKGFTNEPSRCRECRQARKQAQGARSGRAPRVMHDAICASCGQPTQVPFKPREDRPVYCRECYQAQRLAGGEF